MSDAGKRRARNSQGTLAAAGAPSGIKKATSKPKSGGQTTQRLIQNSSTPLIQLPKWARDPGDDEANPIQQSQESTYSEDDVKEEAIWLKLRSLVRLELLREAVKEVGDKMKQDPPGQGAMKQMERIKGEAKIRLEFIKAQKTLIRQKGDFAKVDRFTLKNWLADVEANLRDLREILQTATDAIKKMEDTRA